MTKLRKRSPENVLLRTNSITHVLFTCYNMNYLFLVEAVHLANLLCQFGYYFPVNEQKNLLVKDDSSLYRFQVEGR